MLKLEKINQYLYRVDNTGSCNIGVCVKDGSALVIDSGYLPLISKKVIELIRDKLDCKVDLLINTHYHADHTFGNQSFTCPILACQTTVEIMRTCLLTYWHRDCIKQEMDDDPAMAKAWKNLKITFPTETFDREKHLDFMGLKIILKNVGGHTPDSSTVFFPDLKVLFSGDIVFNRIYPTLLRHDGHPYKLIEVLQGLRVMDIDTIVPGHGPIGDKTSVGELIRYWEGLTVRGRKYLEEKIDFHRVGDILVNECHLGEIPFSEARHKRNIDSVLFFLNKRLNKNPYGAKGKNV